MHCHKQIPAGSRSRHLPAIAVTFAAALSLSACGTADKVTENELQADATTVVTPTKTTAASEPVAIAPLPIVDTQNATAQIKTVKQAETESAELKAVTQINNDAAANLQPAIEPAVQAEPAAEPALQEKEEAEAETLNITLATIRAERGDVKSQIALGYAYTHGTPRVEKDPEQAKLWFELAALNGDSKAQYELGKLFYIGRGTNKDYFNAREWWLESALQGNLDAQQRLGYLYSEGLGVERDYDKAQLWYKKAAQQGHAEAQTLLGSLYHEGNRIPTNYIEAFKWYKLAAEQGHPHAQYTLATLYHDGLGTKVDYIQCAAWIDVALANGFDDEFNVSKSCRGHLDETSNHTATHLADSWKKRYLATGI